jgi:hypothetical protein
MSRPEATSAGAASLARLAEVAWASARSNDLPALVELVGASCTAAVQGREWRFLTVQADSGATPGARAKAARRAAEPGERSRALAHESPLVAERRYARRAAARAALEHRRACSAGRWRATTCCAGCW